MKMSVRRKAFIHEAPGRVAGADESKPGIAAISCITAVQGCPCRGSVRTA
jgi:hypothetical protein